MLFLYNKQKKNELKTMDGLRLKCSRQHPIPCNHVWLYKGTNIHRTTCPKCGTTVIPHKSVVNKRDFDEYKEIYKKIQQDILIKRGKEQ